MIPYNLYQNGVSEQSNWTFKVKFRSTIIDLCLTKRLWSLRCQRFIQLINSFLTRMIPDIIILSTWKEEIPDIADVCIFKGRVFMFISKERQTQNAK